MTDDPQLQGTWRYPTTIRFGAGQLVALPEACAGAGIERPLLVTDPLLADHPMVRRALDLLTQAGMPAATFTDLQPDPVAANARDGVRAFRSGAHDGVVAMGGGSALDTGKVIALMGRQEEDIWDLDGRWDTLADDSIAPVVAIPTTAGTGSEVGRAAVITHQREQVKKILLHGAMMPRQVIADPELTLSLPQHLTAATGMDALAHSLEALCAPFYHPMADGIALEATRLVHRWLPAAYLQGDDPEARSHMMAAAIMGATAFQKGLGAVHALSHPLGAVHHLHHGLTNAVVMPYVLAFNRPAIEGAMTRLARTLDLPDPGFEAVQHWILDLRRTLDIPHTLRDAGLDTLDLDRLAGMAAADPCAPENPVPVGPKELRSLFEHALYGTGLD